MKEIKIFGLKIPLTRERRPSLVGTTVRIKGKPPRTGVVTSERWGGWRLTVACDPLTKSTSKTPSKNSPHRAPEFVTVWRGKILR